MLELNSTIQKRNPLLIDEQKQVDQYASLQQKLIAIICISFFPLMYLIGSTVVKYFG